MGQSIVVVAEARNGKLRQVSLEALHLVRAARTSPDDRICAVLVGHSLAEAAERLRACVDGTTYVVDDARLAAYNPEAYAAAVRSALGGERPDFVALGHTALGRDLAPALAAWLDAGQLSDVVALEGAGDALAYVRPLYAGKLLETRRFAPGAAARVVTVRPSNLPPAEPLASPGRLEAVVYAPPDDLRAVVKDVIRQAAGRLDLTEARIIVSGGRGVRSADGFKPLRELAAVLGAAVGASRAACDAGYCEYALQIGQTGKVVTPELYIACGISGAIQHLAGMSRSRVIVAINKDPEAPIFKVADYGIVGDLFEIVPLLTEEFKKLLASSTA
ncbi:electron transfer flavoprotein subunit alpha/FixB family protein [Cohnella fermenti]|uniref:Electron transfer flavoprotein subunit alpha/FixB family protein n=1 Tax=Cohnella fermenti TaxID=2565925 RepID=A0A4S4BSQ4_9BACL|nr:electron transfer flavoprotein subunit alpha/FixB family protein [Cohnella fermenti]THF77530.1 electron transfer flavoprotein subunit alpha/FixB family protein [Cohnella fermenti]